MFVAAGKKRKFAPTSRNSAERVSVRRTWNNDTHGPTSMDTIKRYYVLGQENARERQYRAALDCYNRAIAISINDESVDKEAKIYEARAHVLYKLREFTRAMDDAKEAIAIDSNSAAGYTQMAGILAATGKRRDALAVLERGLATVDKGAPGYAHMETLRVSVARQLDPSAVVDLQAKTTDPAVYLPSDLVILILRSLDIRTLVVCRAVSRRWLALVDNTPVLWSRPSFTLATAATRLAQQLPAYKKLQKWIKQSSSGRIPDKIIRFVFQRARGSLVSATVPENSLVSNRTLDFLLAQKRPCLRQIDIYRVAEIGPDMLSQMLNGWCVPKHLAELRLPYCANIDNSAISTIVRCAPGIRVLDISGCHSVRVKHMFKAWSSVLLDAHDSTNIEHLYMNDHPGIPDLLVYSTRYCHFAKLRSLHIAIYDQRVFSMFSSIAPLVDYLRRNQASRTQSSGAPFPQLEELNVDGIWDIPVSSLRFGSTVLCNLVFQCRIFAEGLRRLSAVESPGMDRGQLVEALWSCLPTLQRLHLTKATNIDTQLLVDFAFSHQGILPLASLDLSGCVGIGPQGLYALISCCTNLVYVNLSGTAVDNRVMCLFTQMVSAPCTPGPEVLVLDTTDISGVAVRDFAAACIKRYRLVRSDPHAKQAWKLRILDIDNCANVGSDAVAVVRELLSLMGTQVLAAVPV
ncbi:hypothetical protein IW140_003510 [Coemansia sp. RSA 1813]|nr:hypothetical protein EV178_003400 [Coemansia sp. RSA 1646]KAJ1772928.1 hypothetical protein LPJ74_001067 [Coemansia sp. RSA 1843]KAJ2214320.1 hypothetical protein EV179_003100 [Coemansia sp. RSA 487]KAJ2568886.1 hypothetical protein IW140_003510 [Coemansia sp. RSA 1813]